MIGHSLIFCNPKDSDLPNYKACLENNEFKKMLYGCQRFDINRFLKKEKNILKYSVFTSNGIFIGFVQLFYKQNNRASFLGGVAPNFFNSGLGVKACVFILDYIFHKDILNVITGVYLYNLRSLKMLKAIGFVETSLIQDKVILTLDKTRFNDNNFNKIILDKIRYKII